MTKLQKRKAEHELKLTNNATELAEFHSIALLIHDLASQINTLENTWLALQLELEELGAA
ncbi:hypothetical protein D9M68_887830 [compost metagenome]